MSYPVAFEADYVERRSRLSVFFRLILAIPLAIWICLYGIVAYCVVVIAWFKIVFTGRYPSGMYNFVARYARMGARISAYITLLCDRYPSFDGADDQSYPVRMHFAGPLPRYSRLKTLFRAILGIPVSILQYVIGWLVQIVGLAAWLVIVVTGRLPRGLFNVMEFCNSYSARASAYLLLLTETYPPFQDGHTPVEIGDQPVPGSGWAM